MAAESVHMMSHAFADVCSDLLCYDPIAQDFTHLPSFIIAARLPIAFEFVNFERKHVIMWCQFSEFGAKPWVFCELLCYALIRMGYHDANRCAISREPCAISGSLEPRSLVPKSLTWPLGS